MKKLISLFMLITVCFALVIGCNKTDTTSHVAIDYSLYPFVNISWTREADHDFETIRFTDDGCFSYSCACGNPVNDSDLCEGYTYDDKTKTITLDCFETTDEMITVIKIVKCDEQELHLDFDGDIRIFTK